MVTLDAATVKQDNILTLFFLDFGAIFFHSGKKNAVVVSMVVLPALQMRLLTCLGFSGPSQYFPG